MTSENHVLKALIDAANFLEFSGTTEIDPDAAVMAMEQMSLELSKISTAERLILLGQAERLASEFDEPRRAFVSRLFRSALEGSPS